MRSGNAKHRRVSSRSDRSFYRESAAFAGKVTGRDNDGDVPWPFDRERFGVAGGTFSAVTSSQRSSFAPPGFGPATSCSTSVPAPVS